MLTAVITKHFRWDHKPRGFSPSQRLERMPGLPGFPEARRQASIQLQMSPAVSKSICQKVFGQAPDGCLGNVQSRLSVSAEHNLMSQTTVCVTS